MRGFILGIVLTLAVSVGGAYAAVSQGWVPANADSPPSSLEAWAARTSLHMTLDREAPRTPDPVALTDANLVAGIKLYGANCAACHGVADGMASNIAVGLYQHAPQLGRHGVTDDPEGVTFWKIKHGIRLTGMPAFSNTLADTQIWQMTLFLKHMDALSPAAEKAWKALANPVQIAPKSAQPPPRRRG